MEIYGSSHHPVGLSADADVTVTHACAGSELWARVYVAVLHEGAGDAEAAQRANSALEAFKARNGELVEEPE